MASIDESHEVEGIEYIYKRNFVFGNPYFELMTFKDFSEGGVVKLYNKEFSLNDMLEHAEIVFNSANVKRNIIFAKKNGNYIRVGAKAMCYGLKRRADVV